MKKIIAFLCVMFLLTSFVACGNDSSSKTTIGDLEKMQEKMLEAKYLCDAKVDVILDLWDKDQDDFECLFNDEHIGYSGWTREINKGREKNTQLKELMEEISSDIKAVNPADDAKEYYDALKELYLCVDSYHKFVTKFPDGYSYNTFLEKINEYTSEYDDIESEIDLIK